MRVVVYTRNGCPLCTKGIVITESVFGAEHVVLVDVDLDLALMERYTERVPVVESEDGIVIDEGIISEAALRSYDPLRTP